MRGRAAAYLGNPRNHVLQLHTSYEDTDSTNSDTLTCPDSVLVVSLYSGV